MLNVFLTIDTEVGPVSRMFDRAAVVEEMQRDIYGCTPNGEFGIRFIMDCCRTHGLKAVFFVDGLFGRLVGVEYLREVVGAIRQMGHDIQLHLHPEWLSRVPNAILPGKTGQRMKDFSENDQTLLIAEGLETLKSCGVDKVCAFRAGGFGANLATLRALARNGIAYDTSHNTCWLGVTCEIHTDVLLLQPRRLHGVFEFPITFFEDWPGHYRHVQIGACSAGELRHALRSAARSEWYSFVILAHSFELVNRPRRLGVTATPDWIAIRRFQSLCRFLAGRRDLFRTRTFAELDPQAIPTVAAARPLRSNMVRTAHRCLEQAARRIL